MMRSMYSGVSGLRTHQTKMDVIGNNIANVNTTAFKSQRVTFNEVFSQTIQSASSANADTGRGGLNPMQVGLGVNVSSIDMLMTQGAAQRTDNPFDLMIDGDGFMVVEDATGQYFTRAGALRKDDDGNLIIANGMKVVGWQATDDGKSIMRSNVTAIELDSPKNNTAKPEATKKVQLTGNLNTADALMKDADGNLVSDPEGISMQIKMYDSLGNLYSMNMRAIYTPANPGSPEIPAVPADPDDPDDTGTPVVPAVPKTDAKWKLSPIKEDGGVPDETESYTSIITDQNGYKHEINLRGAGPTLEFDVNGNLVKSDPEEDTDGKFVIGGEPAGDPPVWPPFDLGEVNSTLGPITVDFSQITQYNAKTNIDPKTVDGRAAGEIQGYDIGPDGIITAYYNNGEFKLLGQVVITNFDNPAGLEKVGGNIYRQTASSGEFDGIGSTGTFQAGVLEMSNVDLSQEFTEMITTQRGFQANSRIISTSDEMLQELVNLKR